MNTVTVEIFRNENGVGTGREGGGRTFLFLYNFFTIEIYNDGTNKKPFFEIKIRIS